MNKYNSPNNAAASIADLVGYLKDANQTKYAYRGQIKEYNGPLLPSYYRRFLRHNDERVEIEQLKKEYSVESLRNCGKVFYGEYNRNFFKWLETRFSDLDLSPLAYADMLFKKVLTSKPARFYQIKKYIAENKNITWLDSVYATCNDVERSDIEKCISKWKPYLYSYHQRTIRMLGFYKPFGFVIGNALAQQYGLSSLCIDATKSIDVASFFGCYDSTSDYEKVIEKGVGVIYRFDTSDYSGQRSIREENYYSSPGFVDLCDLLLSLEENGLNDEEFLTRFKMDYEEMYVLRGNMKDKFRLPENCTEKTRIGAQKACLIIPDELREDIGAPQVDEICKPKYQYIEDLIERPGVERFYFRHTPINKNHISVTREALWPREEVLLKAIVAVITAIHPTHEFGDENIVQRLELIDGGYNNNDFVKDLYSKYDSAPIICISELRDIHHNSNYSVKEKMEKVDEYLNDNLGLLNFRCSSCLSNVLFSGEKLQYIELATSIGQEPIVRCKTCGALYKISFANNAYQIVQVEK